MLADLLSHPDRWGETVSGPVVAEAAARLERAAADAAERGGWTSDDPLRLAKGSVGWLLRCPRRAVAAVDGPETTADLHNLAIGRIVDAGAKLASLTARPDPVTVDDALAFLSATGDPTVPDLLVDLGHTGTGAELRAEAEERLGRLLRSWPAIGAGWWVRVEEPVRLRLAEGVVVLSGRLDVLLGGPPTDRPGLVVEVKAGRWHDAVRADAHFYGLLLALRDGVAPAAVLTLAAGDGATQLEPIRPAVLDHAAERVAVAIEIAAGLAAGEVPAAHPGTYCSHCPLRHECPAALAAA